MEFQNYKCSVHKDIDASKYCQECRVYFCNKCEKLHSEILKNHHIFPSDKDVNELFTGFCKEKNHSNELDYFCRGHNTLCCSSCIAKIKTRENGKHFDCNVCDINDIYDEKRKNLSNNIKNLENLNNLFQSLMSELNQIMEEIDKNKEKVKEKIQKNFTTIRNELNKREDQLLNEVDNIFEKKFNIESVDNIRKEKKFQVKIKMFLEKGKIAENEWDKNENKIFLVNDCINIEKAIEKLNNINLNLEKYKSQNKELNFYCQYNELINIIEKLGTFDEKINQQEVNITINNFNPQNINEIRQISSNFGCIDADIVDCMCFFISKNDEYTLGYVDSSYKSIIFYDINNNKEIKKLNNAHENSIYTIKHYPYDKYDIILSSSRNNDIKVWNFNEGLNILTISKIYESCGYIYSSCLILDGNDFKIFCGGNSNYIKVFNSKGELNKNIGNNKYSRSYLDSCNIEEKIYLLAGGTKGIEVFNYPGFTEYYTFAEGNDSNYHVEAKIIKIKDTYYLIEAGGSNSVKIWDFVNKNLITKIISNNTSSLRGFIIINNRYIFIGSDDNNIKEFDIEKKIMIKNISKHSSNCVGIKIVKDKNGNSFIVSYGGDRNIYLWGFN